MFSSNKQTICPGDSIEVTVFGCYINKGFILSQFMTSRSPGSDKVETISWMLIDQNNKIIFFTPSDKTSITRIVLTEKIKFPTEINEDFSEKAFQAEREFRNRNFMIKSRQIGRNSYYSQHLIYNSIVFPFSKKNDICSIPEGNITLNYNSIVSSKKNDVYSIPKGNITLICGNSK